MPSVIIRPVEGEEFIDLRYFLSAYAFTSTPPLPNREERAERLRARAGVTSYAVFEDEKPVVTVSSVGLTQNVRGAQFRCSGVWGVATHPAARRKGYTRRALAELLAANRRDGHVFSTLYPFRSSFYERLGFVGYPVLKTIHFPTQTLQPLLKKELQGQVELVPFNEQYPLYLSYLRENQLPRVHGWSLYETPFYHMLERDQNWLAIARVEGKVVGMMVYSLKGHAISQYKLCSSHFHYSTAAGRYLLLEWIARHIDQATSAQITLPPFEVPETWLSDLELEVRSDPAEHAAMGRVLDVAAIGGMQVGPGSFSAHISDPVCPWNEGNWTFSSQAGRLNVQPSVGADCELSIQGLSALVYGTLDPESFSIRGWGAPAPELQQSMQQMFSPMLPYLFEEF